MNFYLNHNVEHFQRLAVETITITIVTEPILHQPLYMKP